MLYEAIDGTDLVLDADSDPPEPVIATGREGAVPAIALVTAPPDGVPLPSHWHACLPKPVSGPILARALSNAFEFVRMRGEAEETRRQLEELNEIGIRLSAERDVDALFALILSLARAITHSDAGSIYLVEEPDAGGGGQAVGHPPGQGAAAVDQGRHAVAAEVAQRGPDREPAGAARELRRPVLGVALRARRLHEVGRPSRHGRLVGGGVAHDGDAAVVGDVEPFVAVRGPGVRALHAAREVGEARAGRGPEAEGAVHVDPAPPLVGGLREYCRTRGLAYFFVPTSAPLEQVILTAMRRTRILK